MALDYRISLHKLHVFCLVVELGGVGRAADHLVVAQPVISAHLRTLQERLGAELFYRDGRHTRLTEAGHLVYEWAREVLGRSHEVTREIEGLTEGEAGSAILAASMTLGSYVLPPILSRFRAAHPSSRLTLHVSEPERALQTIETGVADIAFVMTDMPIGQRSFAAEAVGAEELILVASPEDPQVGDSVTVDELPKLRYVCSPGGLARRRLVDAALSEIGVHERQVAIELGHPEAMKLGAQDGLGVALLFRASVERELRAGGLRAVEITGTRMEIPIMFVRRSERRLTPLQVKLAETVRGSLTAARRTGPMLPELSTR